MSGFTLFQRGRPVLAAGCAIAGLLAPGGEASAGPWADYTPGGNAKRADVPAMYKWNLANLYASPEDWEKARTDLESRIGKIADCKGTLTKDPATLGRCLDLAFDLRRVLERLQTFADADYTTDRTLAEAKSRSDRIQALATKLGEAVAFIEPELLAADPERLKTLVQEKALSKYAHYFDDLFRRRPHVLTSDQERILALTGDLRAGPYAMVNALEEDVVFPKIHDEAGQEVALTRASFPRYRGSEKREVRQEAVQAFFSTLRRFSRSFTASLDMAVKANILIARARNYASAIEASLDANAVPVSVYDALLRGVETNLGKTLHRYVSLRKRLLNLDAVHYYDLYNPLFPGAKKAVTYPEAVALVKEAVAPLGNAYVKVLSEGLDPKKGWVDVYPNAGKRSGAYCNAAYREHPIVFLNYMNELEDVFTLAHEFGHALHFHLANQAQEYVNAAAPIFLAEIASTFNEELLLDTLLSKATGRDERLRLLNRRLENIRTTVFRQAMFAEFERAIHAEVESGGALTEELMARVYASIARKYYGPDFTLGPDDGYEWAYIPHFYYNFYVYQYATGLIASIALARRVSAGEKGASQQYLDFLKAGGSDYPIPLLRKAGVDLTKPEAMQATFDLFAATLDEIERLASQPK